MGINEQAVISTIAINGTKLPVKDIVLKNLAGLAVSLGRDRSPSCVMIGDPSQFKAEVVNGTTGLDFKKFLESDHLTITFCKTKKWKRRNPYRPDKIKTIYRERKMSAVISVDVEKQIAEFEITNPNLF